MKRLVPILITASLIASAGAASAAQTAIGTVTAVDPTQCSFTLQGGATYAEPDPEAGDCQPVAIGDHVRVTFDRAGGVKEIVKLAEYTTQNDIGAVEAITHDLLVLNDGAEFNLTEMPTTPSVSIGDRVEIAYAVTPTGERDAISILDFADVSISGQ